MKPQTLNRLDSIFEKILNKGLTIRQVKQMNLREFNQNFQIGFDRRGRKLKPIRTNYNLEGQKRLLTQIKNNKDSVIQNFVEKRNITDRTYKEFIEKRYKDLFFEKKRFFFGKKLRRGEYYLVHLKNNLQSYFIKAEDNKSFKRQLHKLQVSKGFEEYKLISIQTYKYNEFVSREMEQILHKLHLTDYDENQTAN